MSTTTTKKSKESSSNETQKFLIPNAIKPEMLGVESLDSISSDMAYKIEITPELASQLLAQNKSNREVSKANLRFIEGQFNSGRITFNGETVKFTKEGKIMDGQHRLMASVNTRKSFPTLIAFGLEPKSFTTVDIGKIRTASDIISVEGYEHPKVLASTAKLVMAIKTGSRGLTLGGLKGTKFDNQDVLDFVETQKDFVERTLEARELWAQMPSPRFLPCHVFCTMFFLFSERNIVAAEKFMEGLAIGSNLEKNSPILLLRTTFQKWQNETKNIRHTSFDRCIVITKAWNAYRTNKEIKRLQYKRGEEMPKIA